MLSYFAFEATLMPLAGALPSRLLQNYRHDYRYNAERQNILSQAPITIVLHFPRSQRFSRCCLAVADALRHRDIIHLQAGLIIWPMTWLHYHYHQLELGSRYNTRSATRDINLIEHIYIIPFRRRAFNAIISIRHGYDCHQACGRFSALPSYHDEPVEEMRSGAFSPPQNTASLIS